MTNKILKFENHEITPVIFENQAYLTLPQIEGALGFSTKGKAVSNLYNAHKTEFTEDMTKLIQVGKTRNRIFNREGAWLIGMFARTEKAKDFRKWVLTALADYVDKQPLQITKDETLTAKDRSAIGGIVKKCVGVAIKDLMVKENEPFEYFKDSNEVIKILETNDMKLLEIAEYINKIVEFSEKKAYKDFHDVNNNKFNWDKIDKSLLAFARLLRFAERGLLRSYTMFKEAGFSLNLLKEQLEKEKVSPTITYNFDNLEKFHASILNAPVQAKI